jgi:hypothetical protein
MGEPYLTLRVRDRARQREVERLLLLVLYVLDLSFAAGKAHIAIVDAILTEVFLAGGALDEFIRFDLCTA